MMHVCDLWKHCFCDWISRTKVCTGDFAPPEPEFRAEFWETSFGSPNFGPEFLCRILWFCFLAEETPWKIHPREIHLSKFTPKFNPEIGPKTSHCTSAGPSWLIEFGGSSLEHINENSQDWSGVWGRGCDEAKISEEKRLSLNEGRAFSEWRLCVKELHRKGNSLKRFCKNWIFRSRPLPKSPLLHLDGRKRTL